MQRARGGGGGGCGRRRALCLRTPQSSARAKARARSHARGVVVRARLSVEKNLRAPAACVRCKRRLGRLSFACFALSHARAENQLRAVRRGDQVRVLDARSRRQSGMRRTREREGCGRARLLLLLLHAPPSCCGFDGTQWTRSVSVDQREQARAFVILCVSEGRRARRARSEQVPPTARARGSRSFDVTPRPPTPTAPPAS